MILNMHRIPPVGADDTGGPFGSEYTRRAEVVAPYIGSCVPPTNPNLKNNFPL